MRIRYTRRAFLDREAIFDYLDERSPKGAINVQRAVVRAIRALETYPGLGRVLINASRLLCDGRHIATRAVMLKMAAGADDSVG